MDITKRLNMKIAVRYACAVLLIMSSIALAFIQVFDIDDIAGGTLMYIAQAFLLAGSIFGLDYYIKKLNDYVNGSKNTPNNPTSVSSHSA